MRGEGRGGARRRGDDGSLRSLPSLPLPLSWAVPLPLGGKSAIGSGEAPRPRGGGRAAAVVVRAVAPPSLRRQSRHRSGEAKRRAPPKGARSRHPPTSSRPLSPPPSSVFFMLGGGGLRGRLHRLHAAGASPRHLRAVRCAQGISRRANSRSGTPSGSLLALCGSPRICSQASPPDRPKSPLAP